jgi:hypothetical protein
VLLNDELAYVLSWGDRPNLERFTDMYGPPDGLHVLSEVVRIRQLEADNERLRAAVAAARTALDSASPP